MNARREGGYDSMIDEGDSTYDDDGDYASTVDGHDDHHDDHDDYDDATSIGEGPSSASEEEDEEDSYDSDVSYCWRRRGGGVMGWCCC